MSSKSFLLKRHTSPDALITPRTPETSRTKSLSRDSSVYSSHYHRSDFGLDGSITRCPVHDSPRFSSIDALIRRSVTTSPKLSQDPSYLSSNNVQKRLNNVHTWNTIYTSKVPSYQVMETEVSGPSSLKSSKLMSTIIRHKDLKRKMVFYLHKEVKKEVNTTVLEEISDMDRITEICLATLKSMMDSKKHRKYLHHMNNNAVPWGMCTEMYSEFFRDDKTNNADQRALRRKDSLLGSNSGANLRAAKRPIENTGTVSVLDSTKTRGPRMSYVTIPGMGRILRTKPSEDRMDKKRLSVVQGISQPRGNAEDSGRRKSGVKEDSTKALKLMAEIQNQYFKQHDDDGSSSQKNKQDSKKFIPLLTPEEALACKWLRLSPQQVKALEDLIRAKGMDPGIHEHSVLRDYDVFAEIRQLRQAAQSQLTNEVIMELEEENE